MAKQKLKRFAEFADYPHTFDFAYELQGKWHDEVFKNNNPIVLELGCGKGEYTVGLASARPDKNFIGVDIKGNRIWTGASEALEKGLSNVAFLRTRIDFIEHCFENAEVDEIWLTFPDPQPQSTRARKRLTHPMFTNRYKKILKKGGLVHLKTDSTSLYEYTLETIAENKFNLIWHTNDLYKNCPADRQELVSIKTYYEKLFTERGEDIKYIVFQIH